MRFLVSLCFVFVVSASNSPIPQTPARGVVTSGGGWTPMTPGTLVEWVKFDDTTALHDGDNLDAWTAAVGKNLTVNNASFHPIYKTGILNGKAVARFPVANDRYALKTAAFDSALTTPYTVALVFVLRSTTAGGIIDGLAFGQADFYARGTGDFRLYAGTAEIATVSLDTNPHIVLIEWNGASTKYRFDGGTETTVSGTPGSANLTGLMIGNAGDGGGGTQVDVGEVAVWSGSLSSGDKTSWFAYANGRWAVY